MLRNIRKAGPRKEDTAFASRRILNIKDYQRAVNYPKYLEIAVDLLGVVMVAAAVVVPFALDLDVVAMVRGWM